MILPISADMFDNFSLHRILYKLSIQIDAFGQEICFCDIPT